MIESINHLWELCIKSYSDPRFLYFSVYSVFLSWTLWLVFALPFLTVKSRFSGYRIAGRINSNVLEHRSAILIAWNFSAQLIVSVLLWPLISNFSLSLSDRSGLLLTPVLVTAYLIIDDLLFYFYHRLLHFPGIYGRIHKVHHEYRKSDAMAAVHFHPLEFLLISTGFLAGPLILGSDVITFYIWIALRQWIGVSGHCGFALPWDPLRLVPGHPGSAFHFQHHQIPTRNFGLFFSYLDRAVGTYASMDKSNPLVGPESEQFTDSSTEENRHSSQD
ncbi:MAG TPA: hypothetical protein DEA96_03500 [Leptospiraceae bacterium]|nr:hypothetical protein [Spirochaetaceae bacterium]HBS04006.1 hypothetical protein [Leptospiraceae bacterium]|tara:strand:+ start:18658 stop:19482 length:825 start_codon:yes stop_codon:yes gene_type:complete